MGLLLKEGISSLGSKFFPLKVDHGKSQKLLFLQTWQKTYYVVGRALDKRECLTIFFIFSDKSYVATPHLNSLVETVQMRSHNIRFYAELTKIIPYYQQIFPPIKSSVWVYMNWKFGLLSEWEITLERRNFFLREQILSFKSRPWERASSSEEANRNHKSYFFFCKNGKKHGCVPIHLKTYVVGRALDKREF